MHVPRTWQTRPCGPSMAKSSAASAGSWCLRREPPAGRSPFPNDAPLRRAGAALPLRQGEMRARDMPGRLKPFAGNRGLRQGTGAGKDRDPTRPLTANHLTPCPSPGGRGELPRCPAPRSLLQIPVPAPCSKLQLPAFPWHLSAGRCHAGDYELLAAVEDAGGRFVLDATESGERTLPAPVDRQRLQADPREELVRIYFDCIPDVFQRPNDRLFSWLRGQVAERGVRGQFSFGVTFGATTGTASCRGCGRNSACRCSIGTAPATTARPRRRHRPDGSLSWRCCDERAAR